MPQTPARCRRHWRTCKATQAQAHDRKLAELQQLLTGNAAETTMQCRLIGPGNGAERPNTWS